jgi:hypothetical protein
MVNICIIFIVIYDYYYFLHLLTFNLIYFLFSGDLIVRLLILHCKKDNKATDAVYYDQSHETESNLKSQDFFTETRNSHFVCHCCPVLTKIGMC